MRLAGPRPAEVAPQQVATPRHLLRDEVWIVLGLTFLGPVVRSVIDLLSNPTFEGTSVTLLEASGDNLTLVYRVLSLTLATVPVLLVVHLLHRSGETASDVGLSLRPRALLRRDLGRGAALFALVGSVGLAWYLAAVAAGINRDVVVVADGGPWWTVPVWLTSSLHFALSEEVIVCGYLLHRLGQLGWSPNRALGASAGLRASFHLYQGFGGFAGNLAMGLLFGRVYQRTGRTLPLIVAHFLVDAVAGLGYLALRDRVDWLPTG